MEANEDTPHGVGPLDNESKTVKKRNNYIKIKIKGERLVKNGERHIINRKLVQKH
jgi:hypothetical protein